jgi:serine/threonine protein kinase
VREEWARSIAPGIRGSERTVAIKVLPKELAENPERRARFEREAKAVSALSHPHICTLYDIGREDGVDYLVLEYLEGETLADRLTRGFRSSRRCESVLRLPMPSGRPTGRASFTGT